MTLSTVIIDDEYLAIDILRDYCSRLEGVTITKTFTRSDEALAWLQENDADLLLLDIQMPLPDGFALLEQLQRPPAVIFTTARHDYAVKAFDFDVVDYLVKPIAFDRFEKAIGRVKSWIEYGAVSQKPAMPSNDFLVVKSESRVVRIPFSSIDYIEGLSEYVKIYTADKSYITLAALKDLVNELPEAEFVRVHKSYIVCTRSVRAFTSQSVLLPGDKSIPVGRVYKESFLKRMGK
jgi:two-component system response regulator LytT